MTWQKQNRNFHFPKFNYLSILSYEIRTEPRWGPIKIFWNSTHTHICTYTTSYFNCNDFALLRRCSWKLFVLLILHITVSHAASVSYFAEWWHQNASIVRRWSFCWYYLEMTLFLFLDLFLLLFVCVFKSLSSHALTASNAAEPTKCQTLTTTLSPSISMPDQLKEVAMYWYCVKY